MSGTSGTGIQICFCDLNGRPFDDWDAHEGFCLALDWAAANGKITPGYLLERLEGSRRDLGISSKEIEREAAAMPGPEPWSTSQGTRITLLSAPLRQRPRFERVPLPQSCTRSEYGFMVHVKGSCRCPGRSGR